MTLSPQEQERYTRQIALPQIGEEGQLKLKKAKVAIIGLGGLGSPIAYYLAAAGVGSLVLIDPDVVGLPNLQRQILHTTDRVGELKVLSAKDRLEHLNPECEILAVPSKLETKNASALLDGCQLIVDACDNYATRFQISDIACQLGIPHLYGSVWQFMGQVALFDSKPGSPCYRCMFEENTSFQENDTASAAGILGAQPGLIGSIQALEAIKFLADISSPLQGAMLTVDSLKMRFTTIPLQPNQHCDCTRVKND